MNCKQGDLAIIVSGVNAGTCVTCLEYIGNGMMKDKGKSYRPTKNDIWRIDKCVKWTVNKKGGYATRLPFVPDSRLLPITPDEKESFDAKLYETL